MELKTAIETRASIRVYNDEPVLEQDLREMVRLAGLAPSLNNAQPWKYVAILNGGLRDRIARTVRSKLESILPEPRDEAQRSATEKVFEYASLFGKSPAIIAVATRNYRAYLDEALILGGMSQQDVLALRGHPDTLSLGASVQNLQLAATALGYASCWVTGPLVAARELETVLNIELPWRLGALVTLGRAAAPQQQSAKRPLDDILEVRK